MKIHNQLNGYIDPRDPNSVHEKTSKSKMQKRVQIDSWEDDKIDSLKNLLKIYLNFVEN